MSNTIFHAWQSDTDEAANHHFIAAALKRAITRLNQDLQVQESACELTFDRDTHGETGMPAIAGAILRKVRHAAVVVADLTFVSPIKTNNKEKGLPNANVGFALGYAAYAVGFEHLLCVFNDAGQSMVLVGHSFSGLTRGLLVSRHASRAVVMKVPQRRAAKASVERSR